MPDGANGALEESGRPQCTVYAHITGSNPVRSANKGSEVLSRGIPALQAGGPGSIPGGSTSQGSMAKWQGTWFSARQSTTPRLRRADALCSCSLALRGRRGGPVVRVPLLLPSTTRVWRKRHTPTVESRGHEGSNPSTRTNQPTCPLSEGAAAPLWAWASGWPPALGAGLHRFESCHPDHRGCRPAAGSGAAIAQTRVQVPSASPIQAPPKLMRTSNRPLTGGQRVRGSLEAPIQFGSSGGPWAHNPKVEAGFNSLTRNQSPEGQVNASDPGNQAPVRYPVSRPLSESGVSVRSTRTWGTNRTAHPVPFSVGFWGDREGHDQPSPNGSRQDLGELSGMASHPSGRRSRPLS